MLDAIAQVIEQSGVLMYFLAPLFMVVVAILPIPAEIPAMLNGMVFGPVAGTAITWSGAVVGALISFELARRFGRPLAERFAAKHRLAQADRVVLSVGWPGLLALRFVPTIAFTLVNWAAGLTAIRRWTFAWTTALGIIPGAVLFTVSGSGLSALYRRAPALAVAGAIVAVVVVAWSARRYRRKSADSIPA